MTLRKGWEVKKLGEIAEYFNGLTYSPKDVSDAGIVVLRSSNIQNDNLEFSDIVRVSVNVKEKLYVKDGDILMCSRNGSKRLVGKTALIENLDEQMTFGTFMMIVRSKYNAYLLWFFKSKNFKEQISGGENTMINQITRYMLDEVITPIPPLPEQQRIVEILDEAFAGIDTAIANTQQAISNAKELFDTELNRIFSQRGEGWEVKKLGEVCLKVTDGSHNPPKGIKNSDYIMLSSKNVFNDLITFDEPRYLNKEDFEQENARTLVSAGDVLLTIVGTIGRVAVVDKNCQFTLQRSVAVLKPDERQLFSRFLMFMLQSSFGRLTEGARGVAQKGIYLKQLREMLFYIPPLPEQQRIVERLDTLKEQTQALSEVYQQKLVALQELKQSLLHKAFTGELTANWQETSSC